jgi:hypothetical protein
MTLFEDIVELDILPGAENATSVKPWAKSYHPIREYRLQPSTRTAFDTVFGRLTEGDEPRYAQQVVPAPERSEFVRTEADVTRVFNKHIAGPVMEYWGGQWSIIQSSESSPFRPSSFDGIVDTQFVGGQLPYPQLTIVEFKAPGTIAASWSTGESHSSGSIRLGRELRGSVFASCAQWPLIDTRYAHGYRCPQGGCYDGKNFLIFSFPASDREGIKTCAPDIFVINGVEETPAGGIYLRYALDRLIENGVRRDLASQALAVQIGTLERRFDWFDGNPFWYDSATHTNSRTIAGIDRRYVQKENRWAWYNDQGEFCGWCAKVFF